MNDSLGVSLGHSTVPDGLRIDHHDLTVIALIETTRIVGTNLSFQSQAFDLFLEGCPQLGRIVLAIPQMLGRLAFIADENVMRKL